MGPRRKPQKPRLLRPTTKLMSEKWLQAIFPMDQAGNSGSTGAEHSRTSLASHLMGSYTSGRSCPGPTPRTRDTILEYRVHATFLQKARNKGAKAVAIILMHGWQFPQHEREAAAIARTLGLDEVSVSHELSPLARYVARGDTSVLNAYLALPLRQYVSRLHRELLDLGARLELETLRLRRRDSKHCGRNSARCGSDDFGR
jgi:hypothetical protein